MRLAFPSSVGIDQAYPALTGRIKKNTSTVTSLRFMMQYGADIRIMICIQGTMRRYP